MAVVDPFGPGAAAGGGGVTHVEVTYTSTEDIAAGGSGTQDFEASTLPAQGVIKLATFERTLGDSTNLAALLYDGDPGDTGVLLTALFGSQFSGYDASSQITGPMVSVGGSNLQCAIPYKATAPWIRFINGDFSNTGRASLSLWVEEIT